MKSPSAVVLKYKREAPIQRPPRVVLTAWFTSVANRTRRFVLTRVWFFRQGQVEGIRIVLEYHDTLPFWKGHAMLFQHVGWCGEKSFFEGWVKPCLGNNCSVDFLKRFV